MGLRTLFFAEAVSLAHVARSVVLAQAARSWSADVAVACDARYRWVATELGVRWMPIDTIPPAQFERAMAWGDPIYRAQDLSEYAEEDQRVIREFRPDVVVGDFRLSLPASARRSGVPCINVVNAYWSPSAPRPSQVPDIHLKRWLGQEVAQRLFDRCYEHASRAHAAPVAALFQSLGLGRIAPDLQTAYCQGDVLAHPDMPHLFPCLSKKLFIGPLHWQPRMRLPESVAMSVGSDRPMVYVNLGSSGAAQWLPAILAALAKLDVQVIAASAGRGVPPERVPGNVLLLDYAPGAALARQASFVVCNGGSLACHQALAQAVPVLAVPSNLDQCLNTFALQQTGAVSQVRTGWGFAPRFLRAAKDLLTESRWREAAVRVAPLAQPRHLPQQLFALVNRALAVAH